MVVCGAGLVHVQLPTWKDLRRAIERNKLFAVTIVGNVLTFFRAVNFLTNSLLEVSSLEDKTLLWESCLLR